MDLKRFKSELGANSEARDFARQAAKGKESAQMQKLKATKL